MLIFGKMLFNLILTTYRQEKMTSKLNLLALPMVKTRVDIGVGWGHKILTQI
jgi:hypothetical protein